MHFGQVGKYKLAKGYGITICISEEEKGVTVWHG
jgi:hypothetical protein